MAIRGRNLFTRSCARRVPEMRLGPGAAGTVLLAVVLAIAPGGCVSGKDLIGNTSVSPAADSQNGETIIEKIEVTRGDGNTTIRAVANQPLRYFAIRQEQPPAVILNLTGARIAAPIDPIEVRNGLVDTIFVSQLAPNEDASRILVTLGDEAHYQIYPRPDGLVIEVSAKAAADDLIADAGATQEPAPPERATDIAAPDEEVAAGTGLDASDLEGAEDASLAKFDSVPKPEAAPTPAAAPEAAQTRQAAAPSPQETTPAPQETPTGPETGPAKALLAVRVDKASDGTEVAVELDGRPGDYESSTLSNPSRLVVDLPGIVEASGQRQIAVGTPEIKRVRIGRHPDKVRLVLDLADAEVPYAIQPGGRGLVIALGTRSKGIADRVAAMEPGDASGAVEKLEPQPIVTEDATGATRPGQAAAASGDADASTPQDRSSRSAPDTDAVKSLLSDLEPSDPVMPTSPHHLAALDVQGAGDEEADPDIPASEIIPQRPEISLGFRPGKIYHGNLISLDFKDADIQNILRLIAEVSGLNVVAAEDVQGKVTVRLVNVPWDQALDVVLATRELGYVRTGNIIRVAPAERLKSEEAQYLADRRSKEKLEDLVVKLQPVNYAKAGDVQTQVESLLSDRGSVNVDVRTNTLIIKDIPTVVNQAIKLVRRLDTETPQVLIEAKIIEANLDFAKQLGISYTADFLNPDIANGKNAQQNKLAFGNRVVNSGTSPTGSSFLSGALPISGTPTGVAAGSFTAIKNALDIDVVVQALETSGHGRVISSPRITTLDNKEAKIEQGVSIPFQTTSQGDTSLEFIDANLELLVTPHVTSDGSIIMKIRVARNAPDLSVPTSTGDPAIAKNEANTEALVKDGETIVIGGIYVIDRSSNNNSIPYFNKIPGVQWLFRNYDVTDDKNELIIFVTPRIVRNLGASA
jgi:type IV pilus assembly protein PilQ